VRPAGCSGGAYIGAIAPTGAGPAPIAETRGATRATDRRSSTSSMPSSASHRRLADHVAVAAPAAATPAALYRTAARPPSTVADHARKRWVQVPDPRCPVSRRAAPLHDTAEADASLAPRDGDPKSLRFHLDHGRVHVGDLAKTTEDAFHTWLSDRAAGLDAIMIAPTRTLVAELNRRARAHRLDHSPSTAEVASGDVIITRSNDHRHRFTVTDWVKNGDRTITQGGDQHGRGGASSNIAAALPCCHFRLAVDRRAPDVRAALTWWRDRRRLVALTGWAGSSLPVLGGWCVLHCRRRHTGLLGVRLAPIGGALDSLPSSERRQT
jgi:hypothetical protein